MEMVFDLIIGLVLIASGMVIGGFMMQKWGNKERHSVVELPNANNTFYTTSFKVLEVNGSFDEWRPANNEVDRQKTEQLRTKLREELIEMMDRGGFIHYSLYEDPKINKVHVKAQVFAYNAKLKGLKSLYRKLH
jgi:hypothetical protein